MGTIARILELLNKLKDDKLTLVNQRYEESTIYLSNEFELIRKLITKDSGDSIYDNSTTNKRKSSDVSKSFDNIHSSPDFKRPSNSKQVDSQVDSQVDTQLESQISTQSNTKLGNQCDEQLDSQLYSQSDNDNKEVDISDILLLNNLPVDLNRLRKDQLFNELDKRKVTHSLTMKSLKKDMIDVLKANLLSSHSNKIDESNNEKANDIKNTSTRNDEQIILESNEASTEPFNKLNIEPTNSDMTNQPFRKASLMSEFRQQVTTEETIVKTTEIEEEMKARLTNEFEARQKRSRESQLSNQISNLQISEPSVNTNVLASPKPELVDAIIVSNVSLTTESIDSTIVEEANDSLSNTEESNDSEYEVEVSTEVINPSTNTSTYTSNNVVKKPINLITSQTSFLDKQTQNKPVYVAALEKAKLAKQAEDLKVQQKKKLVDSKIASNSAKPVVTSNHNTSNNPFIRPVNATTGHTASTTNTWGSKTNTTTTAVAKPVNTGATMKKPITTASGLLASVFGKKQQTTNPVTTANSNSTTSLFNNLGSNNNTTNNPINNTSNIKLSNETNKNPSNDKNKDKVVVSTVINQIDKSNQFITSPAPAITLAPSILSNATAPALISTNNNLTDSVKKLPVVVSEPIIASSIPTPVVDVINKVDSNNNHQSTNNNNDEVTNYEIGSEDGSDTDDDVKAKEENKKFIPEWARSKVLRAALERQYGLVGNLPPIDPDMIFHEVTTCNLEEIFGMKSGINPNRSYAKRTSSGRWDHDALSIVEKRTYRYQMGYVDGI
eukprot:gene19638-25549_t